MCVYWGKSKRICDDTNRIGNDINITLGENKKKLSELEEKLEKSGSNYQENKKDWDSCITYLGYLYQ